MTKKKAPRRKDEEASADDGLSEESDRWMVADEIVESSRNV